MTKLRKAKREKMSKARVANSTQAPSTLFGIHQEKGSDQQENVLLASLDTCNLMPEGEVGNGINPPV